MAAREGAVVLLSGGMDSCVTMAIATRECRVAALHVSYGQRTAARERRAFHAIADHYGVADRLVVEMPHFAAIGGSALTDPRVHLAEADLHSQTIPASYVPFRNANFLAAAVSWAEVLGARAIYIGAVEEDSSGYPDCREAFFAAFAGAIREGTRPETAIAIRTPVIHLTKSEIVRQGFALGAPFAHTWSCYREEEVACGTCDSCALRLRAFAQVGVADPIAYRTRPTYA